MCVLRCVCHVCIEVCVPCVYRDVCIEMCVLRCVCHMCIEVCVSCVN